MAMDAETRIQKHLQLAQDSIVDAIAKIESLDIDDGELLDLGYSIEESIHELRDMVFRKVQD